MTYDSVFVSDVHLGTDRCNIKKFLRFLDQLDTKQLVLVGDIFDIECMQKYGTRWKKQHTKAIHKIFQLADSGVNIVYILGNHEGELRRYVNFKHKNFIMSDQYIYRTNNGKKYLCVHGDKYSEYSSGSWKQLCFNKGYELITPLSIWLNRFFRFSLVHFLKNTVNGRKYIAKYENDLIDFCTKEGKYSGIICGHIHHGNIRYNGTITYMCCGDFVDTCSAIVEKNGKFKFVNY